MRRPGGRPRTAGPRWSAGWWRDDRGSATVELTVLTPVLIVLLVLVAVVVHRGVEARIRLDDVAHQSARAASLERSRSGAAVEARAAADAALVAAGISCRDHEIRTDTSEMRPGGTVRVTVSCTVDLGDALLLGVPGGRRLTATALEPIDTWRSSGEGP